MEKLSQYCEVLHLCCCSFVCYFRTVHLNWEDDSVVLCNKAYVSVLISFQIWSARNNYIGTGTVWSTRNYLRGGRAGFHQFPSVLSPAITDITCPNDAGLQMMQDKKRGWWSQVLFFSNKIIFFPLFLALLYIYGSWICVQDGQQLYKYVWNRR